MNTQIVDSSVPPERILVVEDDREMSRFLTELLTEEGYQVVVAGDGVAALESFQRSSCDLVITDLMMPRMKGIELVRRLKTIDADISILLITAFGSIESAIEAIQAGAFHYLTKPFRADELLIHVRRALEQRHLRREIEKLRHQVQGRFRLKDIIGRSQAMQIIFDTVKRIGDVPSSVLILGESGTGKEMVAHALHEHSSRAAGPFIAINCAAIPEALLESELFGYVRGAFSDAHKDRPGLFKEANGGTLFLDEIGEMPMNLQAKLLRVIQSREIRPLGSDKTERVDVRLIAATNCLLEQAVQEGRFRQDLFYRLNVIRIELPPLRERAEDIAPLVDHFLERFAPRAKRSVNGIEKDALALLIQYRWPGNIRELEHTIERAVLLGNKPTIGMDDLPPELRKYDADGLPLALAVARKYTLRDLEREYIEKVLVFYGGNKSEAAKILGVDRTTLYRKLEEYKLSG